MKIIIINILLLSLIGCSRFECVQYDEVVTVGQCSYSKYDKYGSSDCVALTKTGHKVSGSSPFVVGEKTCVKRKYEQ